MAKYEDLVSEDDWLIAFDGRATLLEPEHPAPGTAALASWFAAPRVDSPSSVAPDCDRTERSTGGDVLVAGPDFAGDLSERDVPTAVGRLTDVGFRAVIAPSFGYHFFRRATLHGLPALAIEESRAIRSGDRLRVDVEARIVANKSSGDRYVIRNLRDDDIIILRTTGSLLLTDIQQTRPS